MKPLTSRPPGALMCLHKHALFYLTCIVKTNAELARLAAHAYNPVLRSQRQEDCHKFKVSLVYGELQASQGLRVKPCLRPNNRTRNSQAEPVKPDSNSYFLAAGGWPCCGRTSTVESQSALATLLLEDRYARPKEAKRQARPLVMVGDRPLSLKSEFSPLCPQRC